jgi:hypothetical protein
MLLRQKFKNSGHIRALAMMDVTYTQEEMNLLTEAAEHFHKNGHLYSGSYFTTVNIPAFVSVCGRFLDALKNASDAEPERPTQEHGWVRIRKVGDGFHLQADDALLDLTDAGLRSLGYDTTDMERKALITVVIAKSWPESIRQAAAQLGLQDTQPK